MSNQPHRYRIVLDYIEPWLDEQDEACLLYTSPSPRDTR